MKLLSSLLIVAFLIAAIWRIEIEIRGWAGLQWIEYHHLAIPIGGLLFLAWLRLATKLTSASWKIVASSAAWGVMAAFVLNYAAPVYFVRGPTAMSYKIEFGEAFDHWHWIGPLIWGALILLLYFGYRTFFGFPRVLWIAGFLLWMGSWLLGLLIISVLPERGSVDLIHALKTGWMIPFCVIAAGLPIISLATASAMKESE